MASSRWVTRLASAMAFVVTITVGIAIGCVWTAGELIEDKFKNGKPHSAKTTPPRR